MTSVTRRILIVDDEPDIRDSVADILADFGYEVETAADGRAALERIKHQSFDVALLDFKMPGMDGLTLYREMRRLCPETSAILVSAYTGDGIADEALSIGVRRVIAKPVDMSEVLAEVDRQLERPLALVVDDDRDFCEALRDVLDDWGYRVSLAGDEASAARLLQSRRPRVVVLDIVLGAQSDPARVLQSIRESSPNAEVVLVTGHRAETQPLISVLIESGAAAVCFKPLDIQSLLDILPEPVSEA
ncbi:response regulator [bacterium]|nr:response regulator [bacterium]